MVLGWIRGYKAAYLPRDIIAGFVVAALTIPVSLGYAMVAGLPPIFGLYASIVPTVVFALLTSTRLVFFGMDSATVAVTGSMVSMAGIALGSEEAMSYIPVLTLFTAGFLIIFSIARFGRVMKFVPTPVMHGFIAGIAVMVIVNQIPSLLGFQADIGSSFIGNCRAIVAGIPETNLVSCEISIVTLLVILTAERVTPKVPVSLLAIIVATVFAAAVRLDTQGVSVLGALPSGLPSLALPSFEGIDLAHAAIYALAIAIVSSSESLLTVDMFSMKDGIRNNDDRELLAFGVANVFSALIGCAACSASISRTAAAEKSGGHTQMTSVIAAFVILFTVLFLSPFLYYLPEPVLGAVVVAALIDVIDFKKISRYAHKMHIEFAVFLVTAACVLFLGVIPGVALGVLMSFLVLVYRTRSTRHRKYLGVVTDEGAEGKKKQKKVPDDVSIATVEGVVSFMNISSIEEVLLKAIEENPRMFILDITGVISLDTTATDRIVWLIDLIRKKGIKLRIVRSVALSLDGYTRFELEHIFHQAKIYPTVKAALEKVPQKHQHVVRMPISEDSFACDGASQWDGDAESGPPWPWP